MEAFSGVIDLSPSLTVIRDHELAFYDRFLRDEANGWDERPPAELYVLGANEWRSEREWPLARSESAGFHLRQGGVLSVDAPRPDETADHYDYDPADPVPTIGGVNSVLTMTRGARRRSGPGRSTNACSSSVDDVLVYTSDALERDLEVVGPVRCCSTRRRRRGIRTSSCESATSTRTAARSSSPRGSSGRATGAASRASPSSCSSRTRWPSTASGCYPLANVFGRGHRVRVDVTSSSFPRFSRNLNTGEDVGTGTRMQVARQTILHTAAYPSHVLLPVVPS